MSADHVQRTGPSESLRDRIRSALTDAKGWFAAAPTDERAVLDGGEAAAADGSPADSGDGPADGPDGPAGDVPERIETPEERILGILAENGGSVRQGDVVSAVEWSESTVSRRLTELEASGTITRYQLGREKLVFLPGREPESLGSPWRGGADASGGA